MGCAWALPWVPLADFLSDRCVSADDDVCSCYAKLWVDPDIIKHMHIFYGIGN